MRPKTKNILIACAKYLPLGFLGLLVACNLYLGVNKAITHNPIPDVGGFSPLIVLSGSMEPAIYPGDVVVIRRQATDKYRIGDVVSYLAGATIYTHRIVGEENGVFSLKGDNNNIADEFMTADRFKGKVVLRIPMMGAAILFFKRPPGMAVLGLLLFLGVYGGDIYHRTRARIKKTEAVTHETS